MNKYIYAECSDESWPIIKTKYAKSYNDCIEKLINSYGTEFDDDIIFDLSNFEELQNYLNETYNLAISNIEDIEEL